METYIRSNFQTRCRERGDGPISLLPLPQTGRFCSAQPTSGVKGKTSQYNVRVELRHLRYVIAAAEHHSFRRAASVVGVHQSAISRRIRDLEEELGASLFNRHSGGVELTFAGEGFLEHARRIVGQIERAASLVNAHAAAMPVSSGLVSFLRPYPASLPNSLPLMSAKARHPFREG